MLPTTERHVNLGRAVRGIYKRNLPLLDVCPEISDMQLKEGDRIKIDRNTRIAKASNDMMERMDSMADSFPPYGLVRRINPNVRITLTELDLYSTFTIVEGCHDLDIKNPQSIVPDNYSDILSKFTRSLGDTMYYVLLQETLDGNKAILELPNPVDGLGEPTHDIFRGINTGVEVMNYVFQLILAQHREQTGELPTFQTFRDLAMKSAGFISQLATYHKDNSHLLTAFPGGYDGYGDDRTKVIDLDLDSQKLVFIHPDYEVAALPMSSKFPNLVTTGCPARISLIDGKASPILRAYHRLVDIVA